jgi:hypothetical protein
MWVHGGGGQQRQPCVTTTVVKRARGLLQKLAAHSLLCAVRLTDYMQSLAACDSLV